MADELFEFTWDVCQGGHKWVETKEAHSEDAKKSLFLTDDVAPGSIFQRKRYRPLHEHSGLFRIFAEVEPTEEGILRFANEYGLLGAEVTVNIRIPLPGKPDTMGIGEPIEKWKEQISLMRRALDLWEMVRVGDVGGLSRFIHWQQKEKDSWVICELKSYGERGGHVIASPEVHPELLERFRPGDLVQPALCQIQRVMNEQIKGRVSPRLLWEVDRTRLGLYIHPASLLGALWLQFASAVDGQKEYRQCQECKTWFELSPEVARTNRHYCSNACRSRAYRQRQENALELDRKHTSIEEIAKILGTNARTVTHWIARGKRRSMISRH